MSAAVRRVALAVLVVGSGPVGLWALASPRGFYDEFPGVGRGWVGLDGPYNEHLLRDFGGLNLALAFVAASALVTGSTAMARAAGGAALLFTGPHLLYHLFNLDPFRTSEAVPMVAALITAFAAAALAAWPARSEVPHRPGLVGEPVPEVRMGDGDEGAGPLADRPAP